MIRVIKQTHKEKMRMYMKLHKRHLVEMLIECNKHLDRLSGKGESSFKLAKTKNKLNTISVFVGIIIGALLTIGTLILMTR